MIKNDGIFLLDMENKNMQLVEFFPKNKTTNIVLYIVMLISIIAIYIPSLEAKAIITIVLLMIGVAKYLFSN